MTTPDHLIAIDPGTERSAWAHLYGDTIEDKRIADNVALLQWLRTASSWSHCRWAIEMVASYGMPVGKEVFETVLWIGRFHEAITSRSGIVQFVYRKDVKLHLCGSVRAKDGNVRQALLDRYGAPGTKKKPGPTYGIKADMWSALAVATYAKDCLHG